MPGSTPVQVTARAWLELRSKVQGFQAPVRLLWGVAGALDAIRAGRVEEARARCGLILAQRSVGYRQGLMGGGVGAGTRGPTTHGPLQWSRVAKRVKLIDSRWLELFISRLSDIDSLAEKKKLGGRRGNYENQPGPPPKADPKGKGKNKDKGKGKGQPGEQQPPARA